MPLSIKAPFWTRPAVLGPSRTFTVALEPASKETPVFSLRGDTEVIPVSISDRRSPGPGFIAYTCAAPACRSGGVYDLEVHLDGSGSIMPRAVAVPPEDVSDLTVLHCGDMHLLQPTPDNTLEDRSGLITSLVARINTLTPDLVVCTGDLISRYGPHKRPLSHEQIRWQIRRVQKLISCIEVPLFVTLGNHDAAFKATREDWYSAMGGGWKGGTDDYSVDWGRYHLCMMDCFAHYDPENNPLERSFTAGQLKWLRRDLITAGESRPRLLFAHYDYRLQLPFLFKGLGIDLFFYGHSKGLYPDVLAEHGIWDGHLASTMAYDLIRLTPDGIDSQKVSWIDLIP